MIPKKNLKSEIKGMSPELLPVLVTTVEIQNSLSLEKHVYITCTGKPAACPSVTTDCGLMTN